MSEPVRLASLDPGTDFRLPGDRPSREPKVFRVVIHGLGEDPERPGEPLPYSHVIELAHGDHGEQMDFAEPEGIKERWLSSTLVVPV